MQVLTPLVQWGPENKQSQRSNSRLAPEKAILLSEWGPEE